MRLTWAQLGFVITIGLGAPALSQGTDAESVFADALEYTVRVKASISTAFIEDDVGVYKGAGFIVDSHRRWVVTAAHVVGHSLGTVSVARHGSTFEPARNIYVDPYLDLAVLELPDSANQGLRQAPLACDKAPGTGHPVGAFGHPWGLEYTGTQGVISGKTSKYGGELLQTDAPINGGNSGGPLLEMTSGRVIGIVTRAHVGFVAEQFDSLIGALRGNVEVLSNQSASISLGGIDPIQAVRVSQVAMIEIAKSLRLSANVGIGYAFSSSHIREAAPS